jgi:hypothetical protein
MVERFEPKGFIAYTSGEALLQTLPQSVGVGQRGVGGAGDVGLQGAAL